MECVASTLLERAAEDLKVARKLAQHPELGDSVVGFYLQQVVEKSLKVALAIKDVKFPMMEHDLEFLLTLGVEHGIEPAGEVIGAGWLTPWGTTYENAEASPGTLNHRSAFDVGEAAIRWAEGMLAEATVSPIPQTSSCHTPPPPPPPTPGLGRPETGRDRLAEPGDHGRTAGRRRLCCLHRPR
jgi:HEPN domain-containing protein